MANYTDNNLSTIRDGLNRTLDALDKALKTVALANSLPLIGDGLSQVNGSATNFLSTLKDTINTQLDTASVEQVRQSLFDALNNINGDGGNLQDIKVNIVNDTADQVSFEIVLGRAPVSVAGGVDFDIGLPGLGLEVKDGSKVRTDLEFNVTLGFGVHKVNGFFVDTTPKDEVKLGLTTKLENFAATAELGFLQVKVTDNAANPTQFSGTFGLDLQNGFAVSSTFTGDADVHLHIEGKDALTNNDDIPQLPSLGADLNLDWEFKQADANNPANIGSFGNAPTLAFNNVTLNLGSLLSKFIEPILVPVQKVFAPIEPALDFLTDDLPLVGMSLVDLATEARDKQELIPSGRPAGGQLQNLEGLEVIKALDTLLEIPADANNTPVPLGDFNLIGGNDIRTNLLKNLDLNAFQSTLKDIEQGLRDIGATEVIEYLDESQGALDKDGLSFPLAEDPQKALQLLLGKDVDLFQWDLSKTLHAGDQGDEFFGKIIGVSLSYGYDAGLNLLMGFDTQGLRQFADGDFADPEKLLEGFYISDNVDQAGVDHPEAYVNANFSAGPGLKVPGFKISLEGGIQGGVKLDVNDENKDNKFRLSEAEGCFLEAEGKIESTLDVRLKVGYGLFSFTKRIPVAKGTLLSFEAGCNDTERRDRKRNQIAREADGELQLLIGSRANDRVINHKKGGDGNQPEFFVVRPVANDPNRVEVLAYGAIIPYAHLGKIVADGQGGDDAISLDNAVLTPAYLQGNDGNDLLRGGGGNDLLEGGNQDDEIYGGSGDDTLLGGDGNDFLSGGAGRDLLDGGNDFDTVSYAQPQQQIGVLLSVDGNGDIVGSQGDALGDVLKSIDHIIGTQFSDFISANDLDNILEGGAGNDQLYGQAGNDIIQGGAGADFLNGGDGSDWTSYIESSSPVKVDLHVGRGQGGDAQGDTFLDLENVKGSLYNDYIRGSFADNWLDGSAGDDEIYGSLGADTIDGGAGIDTLSYEKVGQAVNVSLRNGNETTKGDSIRRHVVGFDINDEPIEDPLQSSIENLTGTVFNDVLEGDKGQNIIKGLAGDDNIRGDDGDDLLIGGAGQDTMDGGGGSDWADYTSSTRGVEVNLQTGIGKGGDAEGDRLVLKTIENLRGSDSSDTLIGDENNNWIAPELSNRPGDASTIDLVDGGLGKDRLLIDYSREDFYTGISGGYNLGSDQAGSLGRIDTNTFTIFDAVTFTGIEELEVRGTSKNDVVYGGAGNDYILSGAGNDTIYGGRGSNTILADDGDDFVVDQSDANRNLSGEISYPSNSFINLDGGRGIDTLSIDLSAKNSDVNLTSTNPLQENLSQHLAFADGSRISGFEVFKDIITGGGNDTLVQLGRVNNVFNAGIGSDTLNPGLGIDVVDGGPGLIFLPNDDLLMVDYSVGDIGTGIFTTLNPDKEGGRIYRNETIFSDPFKPLGTLDEVRFTNIERFHVTGTGKKDALMGGSGHDTLIGNGGNDSMIGNRGSDGLSGGDGNDFLVGVELPPPPPIDPRIALVDLASTLATAAGTPAPGFGEIDTLSGGLGADTFEIGRLRDVYYVGQGNNDYALITDFNPAEGDTLYMGGAAKDYQIFIDDVNNYVGITHNQDLVAVIAGRLDFDLNANYVKYNQTPPSNSGVGVFMASPQTMLSLQPEAIETVPSQVIGQMGEPTGTFRVQGNNNLTTLSQEILGNTAGLSNFAIDFVGDARAIGTFENDPFGLGSGIVLSTGKVEDLVGKNNSDGGFSPGTSVPLKFTKLPGNSGATNQTGVYVADLSNLGFDIRSLTIADSGSGQGGGMGYYSGFDLDGIKLSNTLIASASEVNALPGLNAFDFSPTGTILTPGTQRPGGYASPDLYGTLNGFVDNGFATLESFDSDPADVTGKGDFSLGDAGKVGFNLTGAMSTSAAPLYLYIGESGDNGEVAAGSITASNRPISGLSDLSTDFGAPGAKDDDIALKLSFDADATAQTLYFQFAFGSEELVEYAGSDFNDLFTLSLNGFNIAQLSDGEAVTINNLATRPFAPYHPDLIYNPVEKGPASSQTKLDGFTKVLTFAATLETNSRNTLEIKVKDGRDGLLDSAVFIRTGTFGTTAPSSMGTFTVTGTKYEDKTGDGKTADDTRWGAGVTLFIDDNNNGQLDTGERTATTDAKSNYAFTGLTLSDVGKRIYEQVPKGSVQTGVTVQTIENPGSDGTDSGNDFTNFKHFWATGTKYEDKTGDGKTSDDTHWGAGVTLFIDDNNNGQLDTGEHTATTAANGNYVFMDLTLTDVGKKIYEVVPSGSVQTGVTVQTIENPGSDGTDSGNDFTNFKSFWATGTKYEDKTGDGKTADDTHWGAGVTLFIDDNNNGQLGTDERTATTDANGNYVFTGLTLTDVGKKIYEVVPSGSVQTGVTVQTIENPGSDGIDSGNDFTNFKNFSGTVTEPDTDPQWNYITGTNNNDALIGGDGNDVLVGGLGNDVLNGGAGADKFRFATLAEGLDTIQDFQATAGDQIEIVAAMFGATSLDQFSYNASTSMLSFDANTTDTINPTKFAAFNNPSGFCICSDLVLI
jgi:Ca2+-binding RTX toxin-like protein